MLPLFLLELALELDELFDMVAVLDEMAGSFLRRAWARRFTIVDIPVNTGAAEALLVLLLLRLTTSCRYFHCILILKISLLLPFLRSA